MMEPGTVGLTRIEGPVGKLVWLMQAINGDTFWATHVFIVLDNDVLFEAQPGGAVLTPLDKYTEDPTRRVEFIDLPLTDIQRKRVARLGRVWAWRGYKYGWTTYLYLAAVRLGLPLSTRYFRRRALAFQRHKGICSQAVDEILRRAGYHLFDDGRMPHDVTPGDYRELL